MNRFLDIEAGVGEETDNSEDEFEEIERDQRDVYVKTNRITEIDRRDYRGISDADLEFEEYMDGLLGRAIEGRLTKRSVIPFRYEEYGAAATRGPGEDDFPLWRVECRIGSEDTAVMYLYRNAREDHPIRSAFTRGTIRGYIYVEAKMDKSIVDLLKHTPGVATTLNQGPQIKFIEASDYTRLLTMRTFNSKSERGSWVRVTKGLYTGDEGIVEGVDDWGVTLLLVPRIDTRGRGSNGKRKASAIVMAPQLFDAEDEERIDGLTMRKIGDDIYEIGEVRFEKGLVVKAFDMSSVKTDVTTISLHLFLEFCRSRHSILKEVQLLKPREWHFDIDEAILDIANDDRGSIRVLDTHFVEATMEHGEIRRIPWNRVQKSLAIGEEVSVYAGTHAGRVGWVVNVDAKTATLVERNSDIIGNIEQGDTQHFEVQINRLRRGAFTTFPDTKRAIAKEPSGIQKRHPWIGLDVVVKQQHNARKGKNGKIVDVFQSLVPDGTPRIAIQLTNFDPSNPYPIITLDSTSVVTQRECHNLSRVTAANASNYRYSAADEEDDRRPVRGQTPVPMGRDDDTSSAWNPNSTDADIGVRSTPTEEREEIFGSSRNIDSNMPIEHVLLHPRLAGVSVKALIKQESSKTKEGIISIVDENGYCSLRTKRYHVSEPVSHEVVTPKYPNPAYDNGLVIVIRGDHVGKYGRRLHHVKENGTAYMILGIVEVKEGQADRLTGEVVEMASEDMCVVDESKEQKKINADTMKVPRQKYREDNK